METVYAKIENMDQPEAAIISQAADFLRRGEVVGFPTETVYGLGGNALDETAVRKIFAAKGRPADNPLIVHVAALEDAEQVAFVDDWARMLMRSFWPGPLTLILPKKECVPDVVTAGGSTVAVRFPCHKVAQALIAAADVPVAAPSANLSGKPSPTMGQHVWHDLQGKIAMVIDGGPAGVGLESTVLDLSADIPVILRPGGVTKEQLLKVCPNVLLAGAQIGTKEVPKSPGMKYPHYSPKGKVFLVEPEEILTFYQEKKKDYTKLGLLLTRETAASLEQDIPFLKVLGSRKDLPGIARELFAALRWCDEAELDGVLVERVPETGIGAAVMNRLRKAACAKE